MEMTFSADIGIIPAAWRLPTRSRGISGRMGGMGNR